MTEKSVNSKSICEPSATVKINFNEMDKSELLQVLAYMQSELEAREIVIAALKSEKCKQLLYQAKYGKLNTALISSGVSSELPDDCTDSMLIINDPFAALQRDNHYATTGIDLNSVNSDSVESNLKPMYDSQLNQLENLISTQKKAQLKMKEQIIYLEKKCLKLSQALEDERNKHERDAAQGDDVLVMLEKERERLKSELEFEKSHSRKLERELKRMTAVIEDQKSLIHNQRIAASVILKSKKQLEADLKAVNQIINKSSNDSNLVTSDFSMKYYHDNPDNVSSATCQTHSSKHNSDHTSDKYKDSSSFSKPVKSNSHDGPVCTNKIQNKFLPSKESVASNISNPVSVECNSTQISVTSMFSTSKIRSTKQTDSLLWKNFDPKSNLSLTGQQGGGPLSTKSPSNVRRQLPNVSMSNSVPVSSLSRLAETSYYKQIPISVSPVTSTAAITPYQKILSTPPPNQSQSSTFSSSLTSYGLFNIHSPALQSLSNSTNVANLYKLGNQSLKSDGMNNMQPTVSIAARSRLSGPPVSSIVSNVTQTNTPYIRPGETTPTIPKHVYVNGK